ncbi:putative septum site-determining protein minD homolog, chloroplastic [Ananas comosus]|uniref:Septum site-determining protein minD homolog, chloroplastic n=1 Tax=Ananas comosus TaxID=4615 RepID=A0A6P5GZX8_ANACO|nr:putative septum site-determining protein minD homolog, chloroplastic [Ananas comosus]
MASSPLPLPHLLTPTHLSASSSSSSSFVAPLHVRHRLCRFRRGGGGGGGVVVGSAAAVQWGRKPELAGETPRVVVVTSGKGGVGKTTTTANVGVSLARLGFSVVAVDADAGLRNLDLLLGLENRVNYTAAEVLNGDCRLDQALVRDRRFPSLLRLLCLSKPRSKLPLSFGPKTLTWIVDALRSDGPNNPSNPNPNPNPNPPPQFVLIDCPAGIDAGFVTAISPANEAVLVTTPDITALRDADRVAGLLECDGIRDIKMLVNIPEDAEVIRSTNRGCPLVLTRPPSLAGLAFEQAAWRLVEQDTMTAVMLEEEEPKKKGFFSFFGG